MGSTVDKLKGKLKKAEGQLTGDKVREAQGWVEEKKADVEGAVDRVADKVDANIERERRERERRERERRDGNP